MLERLEDFHIPNTYLQWRACNTETNVRETAGFRKRWEFLHKLSPDSKMTGFLTSLIKANAQLKQIPLPRQKEKRHGMVRGVSAKIEVLFFRHLRLIVPG